MKQLIKFIFPMLIGLTITIRAQVDTGISATAANYNRSLDAYLLDASYNAQDPFQNYQYYYDNPEIQKLEGEVESLSHVYRYERNGKSTFSSEKYDNLTQEEKKSIKNMFGYYGLAAYSISGKNNLAKTVDKEKSPDTKNEDFFNKFIAPYLEKDKSVNKQKLLDEIKKRLNTLFEMKEAEKQKTVEKLEEQIKSLQTTLTERKKNKTQIIEQRLNELIGLPNTLRW